MKDDHSNMRRVSPSWKPNEVYNDLEEEHMKNKVKQLNTEEIVDKIYELVDIFTDDYRDKHLSGTVIDWNKIEEEYLHSVLPQTNIGKDGDDAIFIFNFFKRKLS